MVPAATTLLSAIRELSLIITKGPCEVSIVSELLDVTSRNQNLQ